MFSGIIQDVQKIVRIIKQKTNIKISIPYKKKCDLGNSLAINGVCLTIMEINTVLKLITFEVVEETLLKTNLSDLKVGDLVNIEFPLKLYDDIGGHIVQGHIDGIGIIHNIIYNESWKVTITASTNILQYLFNKGYITIDGMSITIINVTHKYFTITFIPYTIKNSITKKFQIGTKVNLEIDPISKNVYRYMEKLCEF